MNKVLILSPGPFLKRDYERFGIENLKKNFSVKIFDFTAWVYPEYWKECSNMVYKCEECVVIRNKDDFLANNKGNDSLIVLDYLEKNIKTNWARNQLKKRNSLFVGFDINLIPPDRINKAKYFKKLIYLFINPKKFINIFLKFFEKKFFNLKNYLPQVLVVGGLASSRKSKVKHIIYAHSMDYDLYLKLKNKKKNYQNSYAVFLDEDIVNHQDYIFQDLESPMSELEYYLILLKFFKTFEVNTGLKIKFAIHPKSRTKNLEKILKDVDYSIGNTHELVRDSSVVLLHASTSVSYAVLFKKPAIFLTSDKLAKSWIGPRINNLAKSINGKIINLNGDLNYKLNTKDLLQIDEIKYKSYLDQYLKFPHSPDIPLWEIFTENIQKRKLQ